MPTIHKCLICKYETDASTSMKSHLKRLNPCGCYDDPRMIEMQQKYFTKPVFQKDTKTCKECSKVFSHASSLSRHKRICKGKTLLESLTSKMKELEGRIEGKIDEKIEAKLEKIAPNIVVNNNINVNVFGQESLDHLNDTLLDWCVKTRQKGHLHLIKSIYVDCIANRNVKHCNKPNRYLVHNGETFEYRMKTDVQDDMIDKSQVILTNHFEKNEERFKRELSESWFHDVIAYLDAIDRNSSGADLRKLWELREHVNNVFQRLTDPENARGT